MKKRSSVSVYPGLPARQTTPDKPVEVSLLLSYDDRKKFADFFNILIVVDRRIQARKKEGKNKRKTVQAKARDPCRSSLLIQVALVYQGDIRCDHFFDRENISGADCSTC